ncbi:MAG: pre-toxin TG domain-containing protein, partial [bacterium]
QTYVPKDALEKIEPPPPPPQPKKKKWYQKVWSVVSGVVSTVVRGLPGIGQIYTFATAIAGRDFITGQKLSGADRWLSFLGPLARGASMFRQTANLANTINKTKDAISKLNTYSGYLKNPEQAVLAGLNLGKKYDLGPLTDLTNKAGSFYNSLIENKYYKFGTALTGKDVWGNKLTWEERVAGLKSYERMSDWNNKFGDVIEGIIWKKNITLPKIDLPKVNLPNIDLGNVDFKTIGLDGLVNWVTNTGKSLEGGIPKVLDSLKDAGGKILGVFTPDEVEAAVRKNMEEHLRREKIKVFAQDQAKQSGLGKITDLEAMARIVEYTTKQNALQGTREIILNKFIEDIGFVLANKMSGGIDDDPWKRYYVKDFKDSGFNSSYKDNSNQVRHFIGFVLAGYYRGGIIGDAAVVYNELRGAYQGGSLSLADFQLGWKGVDAGVALRKGEIEINKFAEWIRNNLK